MDIGQLGAFQNWHADLTDEQMMRSELDMLVRAEELGFDTLWLPEHHFDDYSMCPDNFVVLSHLAARTKRIKLATGAIIVPWNDPLRVVEKIIMVDHVSDGRLVVGLGRGLARMEYERFGIPMEEARDRFNEAAPMIVAGMETGIVEGHGKFYPQPRAEIRPKPSRSFKDRFYCVSVSPDSIDVAVDLGAGMTTFIQKPAELHAPEIERYKKSFAARWGRPAPTPILTDFVYCAPTRAAAEEGANRYISQYFLSLFKHYDFGGTHFAETKGYQMYAQGAQLIRDAGLEASALAYRDTQTWGTPEDMITRYSNWKRTIGEFGLTVIIAVGGMPYDVAERSQRLFAKEVMPELRRIMDGDHKAVA